MSDPAIIAAFIGAVALLVAAIVALIPYLGVLHRLERVVNILEKINDPEQRITLIVLRDQLIERLRPRGYYGPLPLGYIGAVFFFLAAAVLIGVGVAQRTIWAGTGPASYSGTLVVAGAVSMVLGLLSFVFALVNRRRRRRVTAWIRAANEQFFRAQRPRQATKLQPRTRKKS